MRYKTFRLLVIGAGLTLAVGGLLAWTQFQPQPSQPAPGIPLEPGPLDPDPARPSGAEPAPADGAEVLARAKDAAARVQSNRDPFADPVLGAVLRRIEAGVSGDKGKDALGPNGPKLNLYAEGGLVTRLKLDLDRDEKWDEKWTLATPGVLEGLERQVSSQDDEHYDREYVLTGGIFLPKGGAAEPAPVEPARPVEQPAAEGTGEALAPHERALLEAVQKGIGGPGAKVKDLLKSGPKVSIYHDAGQPIPNRAKIDLDRDEKWDEKWDFEQEGGGLKVKRRVSSADDDALYDREYRLREGRWVVKQQ